MALVFENVAKFVIRRLGPDGDSFVDIPKAGAYYSSDFGVELIECLKQFSRDTLMLFTPKRVFTIPAVSGGYQIINWSNSVHDTLNFFQPVRIWVADREVRHHSAADEVIRRWTLDAAQGTPGLWSVLDEDRIIFDRYTPDAGLSDCFVAGFYEHPAITADTGTGSSVDMPRSVLPIFSDYAQYWFRRDVWRDGEGNERVRNLERRLPQIVQLRADRMMRFYNGESR